MSRNQQPQINAGNAERTKKSQIENLSLQLRSGQALSAVEWIDNRKLVLSKVEWIVNDRFPSSSLGKNQ